MPRTITVEKTLYEFDELSDRAKQTAADWFRTMSAEDFADFYADSVLDDAARIGAMIGIDIRGRRVSLMGGGTRMDPDVYWAVDCRDSGATIAGSYSYKRGAVSAVAKEAPATWTDHTGQIQTSESNAEINRIARELSAIQRRYFYQITAEMSHGRNAYHGPSITVGHYAGDYRVSDSDAEDIRELLRAFADWIHSSLEKEWEYRQSDDVIAEDIRANGYTFDVDGNLED